ncbi:MAG: HTH domain-containing protein, partial [Pseudomonadota bacterium]
MDAYLEIAESVIRATKRPMTAKAIISAAYRAGVVPQHLYGKTQDKTLQARLSEHILCHKFDGVFFRTEPGHFFLTDLLSDPSVPEKFKQPFSARRRTRDLYSSPVLAIEVSYFESTAFSL